MNRSELLAIVGDEKGLMEVTLAKGEKFAFHVSYLQALNTYVSYPANEVWICVGGNEYQVANSEHEIMEMREKALKELNK